MEKAYYRSLKFSLSIEIYYRKSNPVSVTELIISFRIINGVLFERI